MDVTYGDLIGATEALQALTKRQMPIAGALAVRRLIRQRSSNAGIDGGAWKTYRPLRRIHR